MVTFTNWRSTLDPVLNDNVPIAEFAASWRAKTNGSLPTWKDFDIPDFRGWYGLLLLTDHGKPEAPFCKLFGSKLSVLFGADFTGRHPAELFGGWRTTVGRAFAAHLGLVARGRKPGLAQFDIVMPSADAPVNTALSLPLEGALALSAFEVAPIVRSSRFDPIHAGMDA